MPIQQRARRREATHAAAVVAGSARTYDTHRQIVSQVHLHAAADSVPHPTAARGDRHVGGPAGSRLDDLGVSCTTGVLPSLQQQLGAQKPAWQTAGRQQDAKHALPAGSPAHLTSTGRKNSAAKWCSMRQLPSALIPLQEGPCGRGGERARVGGWVGVGVGGWQAGWGDGKPLVCLVHSDSAAGEAPFHITLVNPPSDLPDVVQLPVEHPHGLLRSMQEEGRAAGIAGEPMSLQVQPGACKVVQ